MLATEKFRVWWQQLWLLNKIITNTSVFASSASNGRIGWKCDSKVF
jgi:hypothetical protein